MTSPRVPFPAAFSVLVLMSATFPAAQGTQSIQTPVVGTIGSIGGGVPISPAQPGSPSATISGSVLDDNDAPVANAMVQAWLEVTTPDGMRRQMGSSRPTDQGGRFILERLQAAEYIVSVVPFGMRPYGPADQITYGLTFYPGVTDAAKAQRVTASESSGKPITIRVRRSPSLHVRGTVTSPSGRSPAGLSVQLAQTVFTNTMMRSNTVVKPDGTFDLSGVAPGAYTISARIGYNDANSDFAVAEIEVKDRDLDGVRLNLMSGGTIHGRVVLENGSKGTAPLGLSVTLMPGLPQMSSIVGRMPGSAPVASDWTFQMSGLYGRYRFNLQTQGLPDYALVRTVLDRRDIGSALDVSITAGAHELVFYLAHRDPP